jgi:hypothetical protein
VVGWNGGFYRYNLELWALYSLFFCFSDRFALWRSFQTSILLFSTGPFLCDLYRQEWLFVPCFSLTVLQLFRIPDEYMILQAGVTLKLVQFLIPNAISERELKRCVLT